MEEYMLPCLNKKLFGVECFGCGAQRSFVMLVHGNFSEAFHLFPPVYTTLLLLVCIGLHFIDKSRNYHKAIIGMAVINAVLLVVSYLYKITHY
ncbi:DUF2752 domain-containing protein [Flavobacterium sp. XGLA_31]|uniref:DUF2752 domain-containing protein n=1 Tax=Flavobacterium sp. XGLA_31 TaxID=3447666 RepID=UPI003F3BA00C